MRRAIALLLLATLPGSAAAQAPFDAASWRADVALLGTELPARHPDAFYRLTRAAWDSAVSATGARMGALTRNQALVALMELVALVHDGHTALNVNVDPAMAVRWYGLELYRFEDGLFIRRASPSNIALAGARVIRIGRVTAQEALAQAARILPHENAFWAAAWTPGLLTIPELVDGLGLADDIERLPLLIERNGRQETVTVRPEGRLVPHGHDPNGPIDRTAWAEMRTAEPPLWQRHPGRPYWSVFDTTTRTLYVAYRAVLSLDGGPSNAEFWRGVFRQADSLPLARLVIDLRENTGGNSFFNRAVVRGLVARPALDRPDRLFVITGRPTFSAAMNLVSDLEHWTNATLVGEPTGNATRFFGDHVPLHLPGSGLTVNISSLPWTPYDPRDHRDFIAPALYTPPTGADYRAGVDPALRAILAAAATPPLAQRLRALAERGDSAAAFALVTTEAASPLYRFRSPEPVVNALGYALVQAGSVPAALIVFRANTRAFPRSPNTWDSLGETLVAAGQREAGIRAYRQALTLDPAYPSSVQAMARLGGS